MNSYNIANVQCTLEKGGFNETKKLILNSSLDRMYIQNVVKCATQDAGFFQRSCQELLEIIPTNENFTRSVASMRNHQMVET